jgi:hypothetical protein
MLASASGMPLRRKPSVNASANSPILLLIAFPFVIYPLC